MLQVNVQDPFILIDAGHGGLNKEGNYVTYPNRRVDYGTTQINEGVLNRAVANLLSFKLNFHGIKNCLIANGAHDYSLDMRTDYANEFHLKYERCLFVSIHHNYFKDDRGIGAEFFTYTNAISTSETIAQLAGEIFVSRFKKRKLRLEGGYYKEQLRLFKRENYHVLRETTMPAILSEWGFMSNPTDYEYISSFEGINAQVQFWFDVISISISKNIL